MHFFWNGIETKFLKGKKWTKKFLAYYYQSQKWTV